MPRTRISLFPARPILSGRDARSGDNASEQTKYAHIGAYYIQSDSQGPNVDGQFRKISKKVSFFSNSPGKHQKNRHKPQECVLILPSYRIKTAGSAPGTNLLGRGII